VANRLDVERAAGDAGLARETM